MFTVDEDENGTTATITPNATGVFVATAVTEPEETTYSLTLNDELEAVMQVFDNNTSSDADLSAIPAGHSIQINLNEGYTFIEGEREGTLVMAELNDAELEPFQGHCALFYMPEQDSVLLIQEDASEDEPEEPTYSITLSQEGEYCHGDWSGDVEAGTICSLIPESGYSFDQTATGTILLASSEQAQLSFDSEKGTIDFEMPAEAVTITVSVYQIRNAISYEGTAAEHVTGQANGAGGEEITIIPNEGYTYDEESQSATPIGIRAFDASDENVELEVTVDTQNDIATFTMPAYAVRVTADIVVP